MKNSDKKVSVGEFRDAQKQYLERGGAWGGGVGLLKYMNNNQNESSNVIFQAMIMMT